MRLVDTPSQEVSALERMNKGVGRCELLKLTVGFQTQRPWTTPKALLL